MLAAVLSSAAGAASDPEIKFEKYRLPNGLTVILSEDHRLPQVAVNVWYHVGAANQAPGRSGFAHLFEHMMFSGAKHIGPKPFQVLEAAGASDVSGSTNFDRTNYYETVPSNELPTALWVESDRMGFLLETLDEEKLRIQRDVVANERRQRFENVPYGSGFLRLCDLLYPAPHPYYECVIGSIPEIQAASLEEVRDFFRRYYGPNNSSLVVAGDFDPKTAKRLIEKYFGPIPRGPEVKRPSVQQPVLNGVVKERIDDPLAKLPRLQLVWNGVKPFSDEEAAGDVLMEILGSRRTSRLYRSLVFERQVASSVSASNAAFGLGGWIQIAATARSGHTLDEIQPLAQQAIDEVRRNGVRQEEVARAVRSILAARVRELERVGTRADQLNEYEMFLGDPGYLPRDLARYRAVTQEAVKAFAVQRLLDDRRIEMRIEPAVKAAAESAEGAQGRAR